MPVTHVCVIKRSSDGGETRQEKRYRVTYRVTTDDESTGRNEVINAPGVPAFGDTYEFATEVDRNATLDARDARRDPVTPHIWYVDCIFVRRTPDETFNGYPRVQPGWKPLTRPLETATLQSHIDLDGQVKLIADPTFPDTTVTTPAASNRVPYSPLPETAASIPQFTASWVLNQWRDDWDNVIGKKNKTSFQLKVGRAADRFQGNFDGTGFLDVPGLVGTETVSSIKGTVTNNGVTISPGKIDFNAGTVWDMELDTGQFYAFSEGSGTLINDTGDATGGPFNATLTNQDENTFWQNQILFDKTFESRELEISGIVAGVMIVDDFLYYIMNVTMDYYPGGLWYDLLDQGIVARADENDPDGTGGTLSATDQQPGQPAVRQMRGSDEKLVTDRVPLDGKGQPLDLKADPTGVVRQRWYDPQNEIEFNDLPFFES